MRALLLALLLAPTALTPAQASSDMSQPGTGPGTLVSASTLTISGAGTACFTAGAFSINCASGSFSASSGTLSGNLQIAGTASISGSLTASSVTANIALDTQGFRAKRADGGQTGGIGIDSSGSYYGTAIYRDDVEAAIFENGGLILGSYLANDAPSNGLIVSGSVGIGTASPASKLHVSSGTLLVDGTGAAIKSMGNIQFGTNGSVLTWDDGAGNQRQMVSFTSALDLNGGNAFNTRIGNGGGNTSIGVTAVFPTTLNVEGNAQFGSGATKSTFTATGFWEPISKTRAQIDTLVPTKVGQVIYASDTMLPGLCVSTGTAAAQWRKMESATLGCGTNN